MADEPEPQGCNWLVQSFTYVNLGLALICFLAAFLTGNFLYGAAGAVLLVVHEFLLLRMN